MKGGSTENIDREHAEELKGMELHGQYFDRMEKNSKHQSTVVTKMAGEINHTSDLRLRVCCVLRKSKHLQPIIPAQKSGAVENLAYVDFVTNKKKRFAI